MLETFSIVRRKDEEKYEVSESLKHRVSAFSDDQCLSDCDA